MASGTPLGQMYIELGLDASKFSPSLNGAKNAVKYFQNNIRSLDSTLKGNGKNTDLLKAKYKTLGEAITAQKKVLDEMKKSFDKLESGTAKWGKAAADIERENAKLSAMEAQLKKVGSALEEIGRKQTLLFKAGEGFKSFGKFAQSAGDKLHAMGNAFRPLSTLVAGGLTVATKKAIDFESQMNTTKSLLADTIPTADELNATTQKLGESSKGWAKQYGISTASINEGMQEIIKKGFDANQTIAAMPAILDASKASGDDFNVVMNASTNILRQFGLEAKDTNRVTDSLTYVANKTSAGFSDMGLAMEYVGPVAHSLGMSIEETSAAIGLLSDNGIAGEKAGTALRGALSKLLKPSKSNANAMRELGFSVEEFQSGALKLPEIIDRIKESTQDWTKEERASAIARAFGVEAQTGMNALINQGGDALRNLTKETENARGYTKKLADELSKSSKNGVERFKASLEVLGINIGQKLIPKLTPILDWANEMIDKFDKLDPVTQNWLTWLAVGVAGAYPALNLLGSGLKGIGTVSSGIGKTLQWINSFRKVGEVAGATAGSVGLLGNPVTWGVLLGGGALLGLGLLANHFAEVRQRTQTWGAEVDRVQAEELQTFKNKVDETSRAMTLFGENGKHEVGGVKQAFKELVDEINGLTDEKLAKDLDIAKNLGLSDEVVNALKKNADESKAYVQRTSDDVIAIYQRHANDRTKLTAEEQSIVLEKQTELINKQLQLMEFSAEERVAIQKAMNGQIDELNATQVSKAVATTKRWMNDEEKSYKDHKDKLLALRKEIKGDSKEEVTARAEINKQLEMLESDHLATMDAYRQKHVVALRAHYDKQKELLAGNQEALDALELSTRMNIESMGLSWQEFLATSTSGIAKVKGDYQLLGQTVQGMSEQAIDANNRWKNLVWDEKRAKLKTNAKEELQKAIQSEEGWNNLQFILKNATLNSNAREMIVEAADQVGVWEDLTLHEKQLVINGNQAMTEIVTSQDLLAQWNTLLPEQKQLLAINLTQYPTAEAQTLIDSVRQLTPSEIQAINKTNPEVASAQAAIDSVLQKMPSQIEAKNATNSQVQEAQQAIDSVMQKYIPNISVIDNASPDAQRVSDLVNSIPEYKLITLEAVRKGEAGYYASGTNFHSGGLAVVNDQKGPVYRELVQLPTGERFIPEGRDVVLPLPRGAKVFPAYKTKRLMRNMGIPKYADGVGIPSDAKFIREMEQAQQSIVVQNSTMKTVVNMDKVVSEVAILRSSLENLLTMILRKDNSVYLNGTKITDHVTREQREREMVSLMMNGVRV